MNRSDRDVVVTGVGMIAATGDQPDQVHRALLDGRTALRLAEEMAAKGLPSLPTAPIVDFQPASYLGDRGLRPLDRTARLAASATQRALESAGLLATEQRPRTGLVLGTMFGSIHTIAEFDHRAVVAGPQYAKPMQFANSVINAAAGQTAIWHRLDGINATISGGGVSGLQAIGYAADQIRTGAADLLLAGGAEELSVPALLGFHRQGRLWDGNGGGPCAVPFDARRNGMALAEGAAFLVLESRRSAVGRQAPILARVHGHGAGFDPSRGRHPVRRIAAGARAIRVALAESEVDTHDIEAVSTSANGASEDDLIEAMAIAEVFGASASRLPVTAVKSCLGDSLGAAGAFQAALLIESLRSGRLPGISGLEQIDGALPPLGISSTSTPLPPGLGLVTSLGFGGKAVALVLSASPAGEPT